MTTNNFSDYLNDIAHTVATEWRDRNEGIADLSREIIDRIGPFTKDGDENDGELASVSEVVKLVKEYGIGLV